MEETIGPVAVDPVKLYISRRVTGCCPCSVRVEELDLMKHLLMNQFGGTWTDQKIDIVVSYAKAYLTIMNTQKWAKTLYFDGFAGSGSISDDEKGNHLPTLWKELDRSNEEVRKGTAVRILDIVEPKPFDRYYFVEKDEMHFRELKALVDACYRDRKVSVVRDDCNKKLVDMASYLTQNKEHRALAFIDPYGMSVNWSSIKTLKGLGIDLWILVPTGMGANRVLVNDGQIPEAWLCTLESFLGLSRDEIKKHFYKHVTANTLFEEEVTLMVKEKNTVSKLGKLYSQRLQEVFDFVSEPYVMRNRTNSIMYHFMMATNNKHALKIANEVIKPKYKL